MKHGVLENRIVRTALITLGLLSLPLMAMIFDWQIPDPGSTEPGGVNWTLGDFIVMGSLIFGTGLLIDVANRKAGKNRFITILALIAVFLLVWGELAVGIFGSPFAGS